MEGKDNKEWKGGKTGKGQGNGREKEEVIKEKSRESP